MRPQALLWCFGLCAALLAGPATAARPGGRVVKETRQPGVVFVEETRQPGVRVVRETPIEEAKAPVVPPQEVITLPDPKMDKIVVEDLPVAAISAQEALDQALAWTVEGLIQYRSGAIKDAHKSLSDAHLMLLEVHLSEVLATSGLNLFQTSLPEDLRLYDPEAILQHLDRADVPSGIELVERFLVEDGVRRLLKRLDDPSAGEQYLDDLMISETLRYIQFFRDRKQPRQFYETVYLRKHKYWPLIESAFAKKGLPPDLGYMAFVESGFRPQAVSSAKAFGMWQFIEGTGKAFELKDFPADFYDVEKSTYAAADYLFQLDNLLGSRLLAVAAYNCGEGNVRKCLRAIDAPGKRSFWGISRCLPGETKEYVPKVLAAAVIGADPKLFGFDLLGEEEMRDLYDVVEVPEITSLARLAELAGVDVASLREVNSELGSTDTPGRNFPLYVPKGRGPLVIAGLAKGERKPSIAPLGSLETGQP